MQFDSVDAILDFAIQKEEEASQLYSTLAGKAQQPGMKEVLESFAAEEQGHKAKLVAVKEGKQLLSSQQKVLDLKRHVVAETIKTQEADGYIGIVIPEKRMWHLWDIHEMGYIILGLTTDYQYYKEKPSLEAAKKLANYIITQWSPDPDRPTEGWVSTFVGTTGLEESMLALHKQTQDKRYLNFCVDHRKLSDWNTAII